jgi:hypothetical protein
MRRKRGEGAALLFFVAAFLPDAVLEEILLEVLEDPGLAPEEVCALAG